jgi:WXG100 family type VII secretion target
MAGKVVVINHDILQGAMKANKEVRDDFEGVLKNIASSVDNLGATFKGKGGKSFLNWWTGTGMQHSQAIINQLDKLNDKILRIQKLAQETDDQTAATIVSNMKA